MGEKEVIMKNIDVRFLVISMLSILLFLSSCSVQKVGTTVEPKTSIYVSTDKALRLCDYYLPKNYVLDEEGLKPVIKARTKIPIGNDGWLTIDKGSIFLKKEAKGYRFQLDFRDVLRNSWGNREKVKVELDAGIPVFYNNEPIVEFYFYVHPIVENCKLVSASVLKKDSLKPLVCEFIFSDKTLVDMLNSLALGEDGNTLGILRATLLVKDNKTGKECILYSQELNSTGKLTVPLERMKEVFKTAGEYDLYFYIGSNIFDKGYIGKIKIS